jgi:hypothetical protein
VITIDENATAGIRLHGNAEHHPLMEAGRLSRIVGMDVVALPDGRMALGKSAYDGSWTVLVPEEGLAGRSPTLWRAGRLHEDEGIGLLAADARPLVEAFGAMIRLPSPVLAHGEVVEADFGCPDDAIRAVEGAGAPRP